MKRDIDQPLMQDKQTNDVEIIEQFTALNNELINIRRELTKKNVELQRLDKLKDHLLSVVAHDLRNPLSAIIYFSDVLAEKQDTNADNEDTKILKLINAQSRYMQKLIEDLLDLSSLDEVLAKQELIPLNINTLLRDVIQINRLSSAQKNIEIVLEEFATDIILKTVSSKIQAVLHNLLSNAIKFSYPDSEILVQIDRDASNAIIQITDYGVGIEPEDLSNIYEQYYCGKNKATGKEPSSGLGLSIVRNIITRLGGQISVESTPGKGSCFTVTLPTE